MRFEPEEFIVNVPSEEDYYNIEMTICLDTNIFKGKEFPLVVNMISSEGEQRMFDAHIPLFNFKEGGRIGTFEKTFQTSSNLVRKYLSFNRKGDFKLQIKQGTSKYELHGIKSIGVKVEKADMELPE